MWYLFDCINPIVADDFYIVRVQNFDCNMKSIINSQDMKFGKWNVSCCLGKSKNSTMQQ